MRAQWYHEQQSVAMAVAPALHHYSKRKTLLEKEVVEGTHNARQGQKTAAGVRPGLPQERAPQGRLVASCLDPGGAPPLALPLLAALGSDAVDAASLSFFVKAAVLAQAELDKRKKREEEREREHLKAKHKVKKVDKWEMEMEKSSEKQQAEVKALQQWVAELARCGKRRKVKKRRKRRTRQTASGLTGRCRISWR